MCHPGGFSSQPVHVRCRIDRPLQRSGIRQLNIDDEPPLILLGNESGWSSFEFEIGHHQQADIDRQHHQTESQCSTNLECVSSCHGVKSIVEATEEPAQNCVQ